ncbi:MAG: class I SAM-dependent methyltransferase, partial [Solirubrobacteraceae bacterium]
MTETPSPLSLLDRFVLATSGGVANDKTVKACCAAVYGIDIVRLLLGESYHPGGMQLSRRLADALALQPGEHVLDVASGIGATAIMLAAEREAEVMGVDLGEAQVQQARGRVASAGLAGRVRFEVGDAERLPVEARTFDAVVCECAFCTFPDKVTAAAELSRALRGGGRLGVTDVWLNPDRLNPELSGLAGRIACL